MAESPTAVRDVPALVRAAQHGDVAARDELITGHLSLIYNIVGRALNGHPDVDDLVQDTMVHAIRGLGTLREPDRFRSWLITIAYRRVQMHLRSRRMTLSRQLPEPVDVPDPAGDFAERTTAELVVAEQRRELAEAGRWLEDADRRLLGLWWQEAAGDLSRAELAAVLEVTPKHAAVRVQRMKAQLDLARGVVRALHARPRCPELSGLVRSWDGTTGSLWRKRLARHVRDCPRCRLQRAGLVPPERLLLGVAALPVPLGLLPGVQAALHGGAALPAVTGSSPAAHLAGLAQHKALAVAAAAVVAGGGLVYAVYQQPAEREAPLAVAPPAVTVPAPSRPAAGPATSPRGAAPASPPASAPAARSAAGNGVTSADIYVAPDGSDDGDGTRTRPYASIAKAVSVVRPGGTIALRGGTYRPSSPLTITTSGTAARPIVLSAYADERPVVDASAMPADKWAITQSASYWTVQDLEIRGARNQAYVCRACTNTVFQRLVISGGGSAGLMLRDPGTVDNQVLDSDFHDNRGSGLAVQFGDGEGNLLRGNRAFRNGGDGINLGGFDGAVSVQYSWSYENGANGFAIGGGTPASTGAHRVRHNAAWGNDGHGFVDEGSTAALELGNNTAFRNTGLGFAISTAPAVLRANVAVGNDQGEESLAAGAKAGNNSWQEGAWSEASFRSTDPAAAEGDRTAARKLPGTSYLATTNGLGASMAGD